MDNSAVSEVNSVNTTQHGQLQTQQNHQQQIEQKLDQQNQISFFERHHIDAIKICKVILLVILISLLFWFVMFQFHKLPLQAKKMSKIIPSHEIEQFSGLDEESYRSYYFFKEMQKMAKDNINNHKPFDLSLANNRFGDVTFNELYGMFKVVKAIQNAKGYKAMSEGGSTSQYNQTTIDDQQLDKYYNYTNMFPPIANQYQCGSCYSFPITATIEYLYKKHYNISVKLSEQQLIDCSSQDDTVNGCDRGNITKGFQYVMKIGLVQQSEYPYRSKTGRSYPCRREVVNNPDIKKYKIDGFRLLPKENCLAIQTQIAKGNVVAAMIAAGQLIQYSQSETIAFRNCPKEPFNHAITIVGQTTKKQWIIRNSWGSSFGHKGYFTMKGGNTCGVCTYALVPFFKQ